MSTNKLTQDQYIQGCKDSHEVDEYDYSDTVYVNSRTKVKIICKKHGPFWQKAEAHKSGAGCPECGEILKARYINPAVNKETFLARVPEAQAKREIKYEYHLVKYAGAQTNVDIVCPIHGVFSQRPSVHLLGRGCPKCANETRNDARKMSTETVIERCLAARNGECTYPNTKYIGDKRKMEINCVVHGPFWQQAGNHIGGQGCPKCMKCGFNKGKPGTLYILQAGEIVKVGITNRTPTHRIKEILKNGGPSFVVVASFHYATGEMTYNMEQATHKWLEQRYARVEETFDGSTECFLNVDLAALLKLLNYVTPLATTETE